ncbi:MAG: hypothetical protein HGA47_00775 [Zoogloea sp.]|nr:hypothetical protein [Zoogloea sp.]
MSTLNNTRNTLSAAVIAAFLATSQAAFARPVAPETKTETVSVSRQVQELRAS